ncbi:MarR family transcriptional regulator [Tsukamurella pulmonis]|uniref:MarR family winged helix-turn-helix transcriptional regulator n=1 Tax=Tsukamurella pulmonis TaxID=47312 RepID=UPI00079BD8D2|nr:MarR family transcriptional regulator [Tsukamurella pulmonis]KXP08446.1 MarR family transcriptional regulator [Tsukamurella pulmonis]
MTDNSDGLAGELSLTVVRFARHLRGRRRGLPISLPQLSALNVLATDGPLTPGQLASRERVQPPSMTRVVASLDDLGLVRRVPHPTDGRQVIIHLAAKGQQTLADEAEARAVWLQDKLDELTPDERAILSDAATVLNAMIDEGDSD